MPRSEKEINILILLIVVILVVFLIGGGLGILYQAKKDSAKIQEAEKIFAEIKNLSSDIVASVSAFGKVSAINGRDITISYVGKMLTINVEEGVKITSFIPSKGGGQQNLKFSEIKLGDNLNIGFKINENGKLTAQTILVLSSGGSGFPIQ